MDRASCWLREIRAPFLSLSLVLIFLGSSVAISLGSFSFTRALLALLGLTVLHVGVNVLNEYSDYRTGIDFQTCPTPFSGGSGMLVAGKVAPSAAFAVGILSLSVGVGVGLIFLWLTNLKLLPLLIVGGAAVILYTDVLSRNALGELFAGLGLGFLPVMGADFIQTGQYSVIGAGAAVPAGILTFNLLLLNEFPDMPADRTGGRRNLLLLFGPNTGGRIYTLLMAAMYVWIAAVSAAGIVPAYCIAGLLTLPLALKPMKWAWNGGTDGDELVPALGTNVMVNLSTQTILGLALLASAWMNTAP
jgi:1,4-dihydroxy-2-naphthoate polyprenyltransferase